MLLIAFLKKKYIGLVLLENHYIKNVIFGLKKKFLKKHLSSNLDFCQDFCV